MRKLWLAIHVCLFLWVGEVALRSERQGPDEVLKRAISLAQGYTPQTQETKFGEGSSDSGPLDDDIQGEISLEKLFKPGRFQLAFGKSGLREEGREVLQIIFTPQPNEKHLPPPPNSGREVRSINWAYNRMSGTITIDRETGEIVKISGNTPPGVSARKFLAYHATLHILTLEHRTKFEGGRWVPEKTETRLHFTATVLRVQVASKNSSYETTYTCAPNTQK